MTTTARVHETACIDSNVQIGEGTRVWHFCHLMSGAVIGRDCSLGQNVMIGPDCRIGNNCKIQNNVSVYAGVTLDEDVFCGPSMVFTNVINPRSHVNRKDEFRPTHVGRGVSIGANATIVCGITLGPYSMIGAGSVVTRDVAPYALVYGNPARLRGHVCWCGETLGSVSAATGYERVDGEHLHCTVCQRAYRRQGDGLVASDS